MIIALMAIYIPSNLLTLLAGMAFGYSFRIALVNVWPHIFKPRLAYAAQTESTEPPPSQSSAHMD